MKVAAIFVAALGFGLAQTPPLDFLNHGRPILDAHNCYPYQGGWADRIDRALNSGFPISIEQDLAWDRKIPNGSGRVVLSHSQHTTGSEPSLRDYFFERVRPIVERSLAQNDREHWPLIILHFDFKSGEAPLLHAVWKLLGEYETWITTAIKTADSSRLSPLEAKPILAITEDSDDQEKVFFQQIPVGRKLRLFGSAHTKSIRGSLREQLHLAATLPPEKLLSAPPTNYRRWWNNSWSVVEEGGQKRAGDWTEADARRLHALVDHAHRLGYWIRFYTLDGFTSSDRQGWDEVYNFGSREAVSARWEAALAAGVNFIATDQYEELARIMKRADNR